MIKSILITRFRQSPFFGILKLLSFLGFLGAVLMAVTLFFFLRPYYRQAQEYDLSKLDDYNVTSIFYDRHGEEIGRLFVEDRTLLKHGEIPDLMRKAVVAVEDRRFYHHNGVDVRSAFRALSVNLKHREKRQGGSTITQQLAKHLMENFNRTLERKLTELFLAYRIERNKSKEEILDYYLNRIYFGKGYFGVAAAARGYFGKSALELSTEECALLAGIIKAPNTCSPRNDIVRAQHWRNMALDRMCEAGVITQEEAALSRVNPIHLVPESEIGINGVKSYFMAFALKELEHEMNLKDEIPQGLKVITTLDLQLQKNAEAELVKKLKAIESQMVLQKQQEILPDQPLQAAALMMDSDSGAVRVLIGGRDFKESPYDRATMARRENGALLQPFLYALSFQKLGLHPASMINARFLPSAEGADAEEVSLGDPEKDLASRFLTIQDAIALSHKACATRVGLQLGVQEFINWLSLAGIPRPEQEAETFWSLSPLTLLEVSSLYQTLMNEGIQQRPYTIQLVTNARDEVIYEAHHDGGKPLLEPLTAQQMALTLQSVVREGTASSLKEVFNLPTPLAGMTGYSEGYRDAWFVGCTPHSVSGVWVGFDQSRPIGRKIFAMKTAIPIWGEMMHKLLQLEPIRGTFQIPEKLVKVEVNRQTGVIRGLGFLTPSVGNIFVYLKQQQLDSAQRESELAATRIQQPRDWSDWLTTMFADTSDVEVLSDPENEIPPLVQYELPSLRGSILTSDGKPLALMVQSQSLVLPWPGGDKARNADEAVLWAQSRIGMAREWLKKPIEISQEQLYSLYKFRRFQPIIVAENLINSEVQQFPTTSLKKEGFTLQGFPKRSYPQGKLFAHGIGFLKRSQARSQGHYQAGEVIYDRYLGASGLEEVFDRELTGESGHLMIATTSDGFTKQAVVNSQATAGWNVQTSINMRIQNFAEQALDTIQAGAVVILNVHNGDIVAMASRPDFNPNSFIPALTPQQWQTIVSSSKNPLMNRAYQQRHPPGSTFKVITSLAAMRAGTFDPSRVIHCCGYVQVGNVRFNVPTETQSVSYRMAIARSYNTYFIDLGLRTGRDTLIATAQEMGVGQPTGIILPGEAAGLMPTPKFVLATHKRWMGAGDLANASIGQGDVLVTPLQMANWMAAVANGGILFRPRLVTSLTQPDGTIAKSFPSETIRQVFFPSEEMRHLREGLVAVTEEGTGTAAQVPGVSVAAKTGTAQVGTKHQPRQIAWISGYLPADRPEYAFCVMVEGDFDHEIHGGPDAGSISRQIFSKVYSKSTVAYAKP